MAQDGILTIHCVQGCATSHLDWTCTGDFIHFWAGSSWLNTVFVQQKSRVKILGRCQSVKSFPVKHEDPSTVLQLCETCCMIKCMLLQLWEAKDRKILGSLVRFRQCKDPFHKKKKQNKTDKQVGTHENINNKKKEETVCEWGVLFYRNIQVKLHLICNWGKKGSFSL